MASFTTHLSEKQIIWIKQQPMYFVATAPLQADGHINLSPKGLDSFRVLNEKTVAYLDITGSGNETSAHINENSRVTFMWCSFTEKPKIFRLYGRGEVVLPDTERWQQLIPHFHELPGARQIIVNHITKTQTSCGFGVPIMDFKHHRDTLTDWAVTKGEDGIQEYQQQKNTRSVDGLPTPLGESL
ncbi:MAG: pyridoxamine 5'-phosphate oxidase family protein [Tunicatimonas sp.]|uniref:pyridoxamine 5'-phosphate oxidase family protein n=1 Tax=Tunicatimonas sp. TaxID=1940096 RepID=UPI003C760EF2